MPPLAQSGDLPNGGGLLPARQLGDALWREARASEAVNPYMPLEWRFVGDSRFGATCEYAGVETRIAFGWRGGEREVVQVYKALDVLARTGLMWWDVWNERTVRRPALAVRRYRMIPKKSNGLRSQRVLTGIRWHDDLGPDLEALERVRHLLEDDIRPDDPVLRRHRSPHSVAAFRAELEQLRAAA
jgi:hypothetical protein